MESIRLKNHLGMYQREGAEMSVSVIARIVRSVPFALEHESEAVCPSEAVVDDMEDIVKGE